MNSNSDIRTQLQLDPVDQVGFVVRDLHSSIAAYRPLFGEFTTMETGSMDWHYRGADNVPSELKIAFAKSGDLEIELIQWISGQSPHKEFLDRGLEGMHHLRFIVDDLEKKVAQASHFGYNSIWQKRFGEGLAAAYLEREGDALIIEFFENHSLNAG